MKNINIKELNKQLLNACTIGDLVFIQEVIDSNVIKKINHPIPIKMLMEACNNGHVEIVKALFSSEHLKQFIGYPIDITSCLNIGFKKNHINVIDFMGHILNKIQPSNNGFISSGILEAAEAGHLNIIKYFLDESTLDTSTPKDTLIHQIYYTACDHNQLNIIKYLLESEHVSEIKTNPSSFNEGFSRAYFSRSFDIVKYFIFEMNISRNSETIDKLAEFGRGDFPQVENWFTLRELNQSLTDELDSANNINKKPKI
jgi:hypothetical protein